MSIQYDKNFDRSKTIFHVSVKKNQTGSQIHFYIYLKNQKQSINICTESMEKEHDNLARLRQDIIDNNLHVKAIIQVRYCI